MFKRCGRFNERTKQKEKNTVKVIPLGVYKTWHSLLEMSTTTFHSAIHNMVSILIRIIITFAQILIFAKGYNCENIKVSWCPSVCPLESFSANLIFLAPIQYKTFEFLVKISLTNEHLLYDHFVRQQLERGSLCCFKNMWF